MAGADRDSVHVLNETPPASLEAALAPMLDVDEALKFLALEVALVNSDGYWARASDYSSVSRRAADASTSCRTTSTRRSPMIADRARVARLRRWGWWCWWRDARPAGRPRRHDKAAAREAARGAGAARALPRVRA